MPLQPTSQAMDSIENSKGYFDISYDIFDVKVRVCLQMRLEFLRLVCREFL
jgi:hypothetical protein